MAKLGEQHGWELAVGQIEMVGKVLKVSIAAQSAAPAKRTPSIANATYYARQALLEAEAFEQECFDAWKKAEEEERTGGDANQEQLDLSTAHVIKWKNDLGYAVKARVNEDTPFIVRPDEEIEYPNGAAFTYVALTDVATEAIGQLDPSTAAADDTPAPATAEVAT